MRPRHDLLSIAMLAALLALGQGRHAAGDDNTTVHHLMGPAADPEIDAPADEGYDEVSRELYRLRTGNDAKRRSACRSLGSLGGSRAIQALSSVALNDADADVREQALEALGAIGDPLGMHAAIEALLKDTDKDVREQAAETLGRLRHPGSEWALNKAYRTDAESRVRLKAKQALRDIAASGNPYRTVVEPPQRIVHEDENPVGYDGTPRATPERVRHVYDGPAARVPVIVGTQSVIQGYETRPGSPTGVGAPVASPGAPWQAATPFGPSAPVVQVIGGGRDRGGSRAIIVIPGPRVVHVYDGNRHTSYQNYAAWW